MSSSQRSQELDEEPLLPLYTSAPSSPTSRATAETAVKLLNREGSTSQTPSPPRAVNPPAATPAPKRRSTTTTTTTTEEVELFETLPLPCKVFLGFAAIFALFCIAIFLLAFFVWGCSTVLKLSWMMLQGAFSPGLPGDPTTEALNVTSEAVNNTVASNISVSIP